MTWLVLFILLAVAVSPAAGKDLGDRKEPERLQPPPAALPAEAFTHPGSPRTTWTMGGETVDEYQAPGSRRSDFSSRGKRIDCYRSFTGRVDCK